MAVFHIYGDESGKLNSKAEITAFCGYVAHVSEWERFAMEWNNGRFRWQVPAIHMARIMFPDNKDDDWRKVKQEWGKTWEKRRDLMLNDFAAIIRSAQIACVGAVVDAKHFRELAESDPKFKEAHRDPIHLSFHTFVMRGIEKTEIIDKHSAIGIVVDEDREFSMKVYEQLNSLRDTFAKVRERVHAVSFVNDVTYPGVQAADMISYEARRLMVEKNKNPDVQASELYGALTLYGVHAPKYYNAEILDRLCASNPLKDNTNANVI
ncbi:MAG: DUF3800 domain-containing protein [Terriglobales bacterium]